MKKITENQLLDLRNTLGLLNSMVKSGEDHSPSSIKQYEKSRETLSQLLIKEGTTLKR